MTTLPPAGADAPGVGFRDRSLVQRAILVLVLVALCALAVGVVRRVNKPPQHNVLLIVTDDQTLEQLRVLAGVNSFIGGAEGTTFTHHYAVSASPTTARAALLTGQYPHNNGVKDDVPPLGGANAFTGRASDSLPVYLQDAGYFTAAVGTYLNGWGNPNQPDNWQGGIAPPPGWNDWFGVIDPSNDRSYDYRVSDNGTERRYGSAPADHLTEVTARRVGTAMDAAKESGQPWFIMWTPGAPGGDGATPLARHKGKMAAEQMFFSFSLAYGPGAASTPDVLGKPDLVRQRVAANPADQAEQLAAYQAQLESLLAIDEWVTLILQRLLVEGIADKTDVIFTSSNGRFHGQHGLTEKSQLYEEAVHVPLLARGPDFPKGQIVDQLTLSIDLTATILRIAGASASEPLDGRDLRPLVGNPTDGINRAVLLEQWHTATNTSTAQLRLANWAYSKWTTGETELYDLSTDLPELTNLAAQPEYGAIVTELDARLEEVRACAGRTCEDSDLAADR